MLTSSSCTSSGRLSAFVRERVCRIFYEIHFYFIYDSAMRAFVFHQQKKTHNPRSLSFLLLDLFSRLTLGTAIKLSMRLFLYEWVYCPHGFLRKYFLRPQTRLQTVYRLIIGCWKQTKNFSMPTTLMDDGKLCIQDWHKTMEWKIELRTKPYFETQTVRSRKRNFEKFSFFSYTFSREFGNGDVT